jgi:hypothetical protein
MDGSPRDFYIGVALAASSSVFIGTSFIIKKKGLKSSRGVAAGSGGHSYLLNPLWWAGMLLMVVGEVANFVAYSFAPAIVVTPMGALSVVVAALLASRVLEERLDGMGKLGCAVCLAGSTVIVLHAPPERPVASVDEIWDHAMAPAFLTYLALVLSASLGLIVAVVPKYGATHLPVYLLICSLIGSLSVMSCKAVGIALRLTLAGSNQLDRPVTWFFVGVVVCCVVTQMNYLNKSLDLFNTARVTPVYYVFFTTCVITASVILYRDWAGQSAATVASQIGGFLAVCAGIYMLQVSAAPPAGGFQPLVGRGDGEEEEEEEDDDDDSRAGAAGGRVEEGRGPASEDDDDEDGGDGDGDSKDYKDDDDRDD